MCRNKHLECRFDCGQGELQIEQWVHIERGFDVQIKRTLQKDSPVLL
jgi:hypothetical protein